MLVILTRASLSWYHMVSSHNLLKSCTMLHHFALPIPSPLSLSYPIPNSHSIPITPL